MVSCGHTRPLHFEMAAGRCSAVDGHNLPLGFRDRETYRETALPLAPGDFLVLYSDGVLDVRSPRGDRFGERRLAALVEQNAHASPQELVDRIRRSLTSFSASPHFADDVTCVVVGMRL